MAYDIRPLSFAEILDRALRVLIDNVVVLTGISLLFWVPDDFLGSFGHGFQIAASLLMLVIGPWLQATLTIAVAEIYLDRPITILNAYRSGWKILLPFLGTYFLTFVPAFIFGLAWAALAIRGGHGLGPLSILALLGGILVMFYIYVRWSLIGPIMIVESRFGPSALRRSWNLVQGTWWRTLGITVAAAAIVQIPTAILSLLWHSIPVLGTLLSAVSISLASAYSATAVVVYYFDRRCRVEDFDLHLLAEHIRAQNPASSHASPSLG